MGKPIKSHQFRFAPNNAKVDVSIWEGSEKEGKAMPSSLSVRMQEVEKGVVYLTAEHAFCLSAILYRYATDLVEFDSHRRLEAWKVRQQEQANPPVAVPA